MCQAAMLNSGESGMRQYPPPLAFKGLNNVPGEMNLPKTQVEENMIIALIGVGTGYCRKMGEGDLSSLESLREVFTDNQP